MKKFVINPYKTIWAKDRATAVAMYNELKRKGVI